jgi:hypothetical protein
VLANRLDRLVAARLFERVRYQQRPDRFDYRLTPMRRQLFVPMLALMQWGDEHLAGRRVRPARAARGLRRRPASRADLPAVPIPRFRRTGGSRSWARSASFRITRRRLRTSHIEAWTFCPVGGEEGAEGPRTGSSDADNSQTRANAEQKLCAASRSCQVGKFRMAEKSRQPARVQEDGAVFGFNASVGDAGNQTSQGTTGIGGIEENALGAGGEHQST